jgi:molybdopterin synthase sulfur carrier subunit
MAWSPKNLWKLPIKGKIRNNCSMSIEVRIPTIMRPFTKDQKVVTATGATLSEAITDLDSQYPGIGDRLLENGMLRRFINVYVNDEDVRFSGALDTTLKHGDSITILPAVAGG